MVTETLKLNVGEIGDWRSEKRGDQRRQVTHCKGKRRRRKSKAELKKGPKSNITHCYLCYRAERASADAADAEEKRR